MTRTPAPWLAKVYCMTSEPSEIYGYHIIGPDGKSLIEANDGYVENEADARLIAAAPDMLAALKAIVAKIPDDCEQIHNAWLLIERVEAK